MSRSPRDRCSARSSSLDGAVVQETIGAPTDGVIIFLTSSPAVADDGLLLGLGAI